MSMRDRILSFLHVPPSPEPPPGSPPRVFRAAPNFFRLRLLGFALAQMLALGGLVAAVFFIRYVDTTRMPQAVVWLLGIAEVFGLMVILFQAIAGFWLVRLDYELRWYMLSDRAIRIREGITTIREKTIALANVQNISVRQGPLQRILGIADVEVKTAGGGATGDAHHGQGLGDPMHVAYFRGVDNASEIRDLVREGVRRQRGAGLGDPEEHHSDEHHGDVGEAAAELLQAARELRNFSS
jgi:uncharacterized membrane protein YdbT with pleckstrin-like domain